MQSIFPRSLRSNKNKAEPPALSPYTIKNCDNTNTLVLKTAQSVFNTCPDRMLNILNSLQL